MIFAFVWYVDEQDHWQHYRLLMPILMKNERLFVFESSLMIMKSGLLFKLVYHHIKMYNIATDIYTIETGSVE